MAETGALPFESIGWNHSIIELVDDHFGFNRSLGRFLNVYQAWPNLAWSIPTISGDSHLDLFFCRD
jgi:hypothetical protein